MSDSPLQSEEASKLQSDAISRIQNEQNSASVGEQAENVNPSDSKPDFLASTVESPGKGGDHSETSVASLAGSFLGRYRVDQLLGLGGFGEVWRGYDPDQNRVVAIKLARRDRVLPAGTLNSLEDEGKKAASLSHPGIVKVYDVGRLDDSFFLVSEFIDGETLSDVLKRGPITTERAVSIVIDIARALHHAHSKDMIHRDVKPGNILLRESGAAVLTDFGLALLEREIADQPNGLSGTFKFMSPEQALGDTIGIDFRTDIFSLGLVLYVMLSGRLPYPPADNATHLRYLTTRAPRPIRTIVQSCPKELDTICLRCLEMSPRDRFMTCLELADSLDAWLKSNSSEQSDVAVPVTVKASSHRMIMVSGLTAVVMLSCFFFLSRPSQNYAPLHSENLFTPATATEAGSLVLDENWAPLLNDEPQMVAWRDGDGRGLPEFDELLNKFAVRSDRTRWLVSCTDLEHRPFTIRTLISVDNWIGYGGVVWGLREDPNAFPENQLACLAVEYFRSDEAEPAKMVVREITLRQYGHNEIRIEQVRPIAELPIPIPDQEEVVLEVDVDTDNIRVRFNAADEWQPIDLLEKTVWLPNGRAAIGLTGKGRNVVFRSLSVRSLP